MIRRYTVITPLLIITPVMTAHHLINEIKSIRFNDSGKVALHTERFYDRLQLDSDSHTRVVHITIFFSLKAGLLFIIYLFFQEFQSSSSLTFKNQNKINPNARKKFRLLKHQHMVYHSMRNFMLISKMYNLICLS